MILIVEDDHTAATAFGIQAEKSGCTALIADTISDATILLSKQRQQIAAIILDLGMPDCDGLDLLRRHPELGNEIPIIVATADGSINRAIEAMRLNEAYDLHVTLTRINLSNRSPFALLRFLRTAVPFSTYRQAAIF